MKYTEFTEKADGLGYEVYATDDLINVYQPFEDSPFVSIDRHEENSIQAYYVANEKDGTDLVMLQFALQLATTPLNERGQAPDSEKEPEKTEPKYWIHLFKGDRGYLNQNTDNHEIFTDNPFSTNNVKTTFTEMEYALIREYEYLNAFMKLPEFDESETKIFESIQAGGPND